MPQSIPKGLTRSHILDALADLKSGVSHSFGEPTKYELVHEGRGYPPKAVIGVALHRLLQKSVGPSDFSGGNGIGQANYVLRNLGFTIERKVDGKLAALVADERQLRQQMWQRLLDAGGPIGLSPDVLRQAGVYGGAQGIWVDKSRTGILGDNGVTVGLLHTGMSYRDDLSEDGVLYHYPKTGRPAGRDQAEINATKAAGELELPVFVISHSSASSATRDVRRGWVESWDDELSAFLVSFREEPPLLQLDDVDDLADFSLTAPRAKTHRLVNTRPGQQRFKFNVLRRYGGQCAVCEINVPELLDACHIRPKEREGSDDARNGLVLCASHHRAYDAGLFDIDCDSLQLQFPDTGPTARDLGITKASLDHLRKKPHADALAWRRAQCKLVSKAT